MWQAGSVRIVEEHFISNLIRRKICAAIDNVFQQPNSNSKKFVLFLPENEHHELMLMYTEYILRKQNHHVVYFGISIPIDELDFVSKHHKPDYFFTYLTVPAEGLSIQQYIEQLVSSIPGTKIIIGGSLLSVSKLKLPSRCITVQSTNELLSAIS